MNPPHTSRLLLENITVAQLSAVIEDIYHYWAQASTGRKGHMPAQVLQARTNLEQLRPEAMRVRAAIAKSALVTQGELSAVFENVLMSRSQDSPKASLQLFRSKFDKNVLARLPISLNFLLKNWKSLVEDRAELASRAVMAQMREESEANRMAVLDLIRNQTPNSTRSTHGFGGLRFLLGRWLSNRNLRSLARQHAEVSAQIQALALEIEEQFVSIKCTLPAEETDSESESSSETDEGLTYALWRENQISQIIDGAVQRGLYESATISREFFSLKKQNDIDKSRLQER